VRVDEVAEPSAASPSVSLAVLVADGALPMSAAMTAMSGSVMPCVVTAGVPTRMPRALGRRLRVVRDGVLASG